MEPALQFRNVDPDPDVMHCTVHPDRETTLRCNKCGRPMCTQCAVQTPVGYRCRECVRGIQANYYKATQNDYIVIFAVVAGLTAVGAAIASAINLGILLTLFIAIPAGGGIGELALRLTSRRRGRQSANIAAAGAVIGGLAGGFIRTFLYYQSMMAAAGVRAEDVGGSLANLVMTMTFNDVSLLVFVGLVAVAVYGRFKMRS